MPCWTHELWHLAGWMQAVKPGAVKTCSSQDMQLFRCALVCLAAMLQAISQELQSSTSKVSLTTTLGLVTGWAGEVVQQVHEGGARVEGRPRHANAHVVPVELYCEGNADPLSYAKWDGSFTFAVVCIVGVELPAGDSARCCAYDLVEPQPSTL